jgi:hypothetical protein
MKALELKPQYEQAMEYLGALYFWWRDPAPITKDLRAIILRQQRWARRDDVRQIYTRIAEINPRHGLLTTFVASSITTMRLQSSAQQRISAPSCG